MGPIRLRMTRVLVGTLTIAAVYLAAAAAQTPAGPPDVSDALRPPSIPVENLEEYIIHLRQDVLPKKVDILGKALQLSTENAGKFWPIYAAYSSELIELSNIRQRVARDFSANYTTMDEKTADDLAQRMLRFHARRDALLQRYYQSVKAQVGAKLAARFLQLETRLTLLHDLQIAAEVPLLK